MITPQAQPSRNPARPGKDTGDEFLFYDGDGQNVHILNGTAREIYLMCDGDRSVEGIASEMARRYASLASDDQVSRDTLDAIETMTRLGLLVLA